MALSDQEIQTTVAEIQQRFGLNLLPGEKPLQVYMRHWAVLVRRIWWLSVVLLVVVSLGWWWLTRPRGQTTLAPGGLLFFVLLAAAIAVALFYVDWRNDALLMTDQRLIHVERVILFFQSEQATLLSNVQNVRSTVSGLFNRLLNSGEIEIETAARGNDIRFGPIQEPQRAQREIMSRVQAIRAQVSSKLLEETILHKIDPDRYPAPKPIATAGPEQAQGIRILVLPSNPLVEGDRITWYKHYFFLFRRLLAYLALLVLAVVTAVLLVNVEVSSSVWIVWGAIVGLVVLLVVVNYQIWLGDIYMVTADTIVDIRRTPFGLFGETRRAADLGRIQNITYRQPGLLANLLNFGNVLIQTAGEEDFTFDRVPRPADVQREIYRRQGLARQREEQRRREQIAEYIAAYHRRVIDEPPGEERSPQGPT